MTIEINDSVIITFTGNTIQGKVGFKMIIGRNCENRLPAVAQALVYVAAKESKNGFEKEIEIITANVMDTKITK